MQDKKEKILKLKCAIGSVFRIPRMKSSGTSLSGTAPGYETDKGTLSKIERGIYDCRISTAWQVSEANGIKFSDFAKMLEDELGEGFTFTEL